MNLNNFQDKAIVEGEILQSEFAGKDELKRSIQKETAVSSILLCKGEVYFYQHPFSRDGYGEIFIPTCTTSLKYKSYNQPKKIVEHFANFNIRKTARFRSSWLMDFGISFWAFFVYQREHPAYDQVGMTVKIVEMCENYFAEPGF